MAVKFNVPAGAAGSDRLVRSLLSGKQREDLSFPMSRAVPRRGAGDERGEGKRGRVMDRRGGRGLWMGGVMNDGKRG